MTAARPRPDFIIGGAPRAATSWLVRAAERHPGIAMNRPYVPEPKFFLIPDVYARGPEHYARTWFAHAGADQLWGEKSTNYLESAAAAARVRDFVPGVKLVFLLRHPTERAISNYFWTRRNGLESEEPSRALDPEREREREAGLEERLRYARPHAYVSRGLYAQLLRPWLAAFPRPHILVLRHEDVAARPRELLSALHRFLGLAERPQDADGLGLVNEVERDLDVPPDVRRRLDQIYAGPNAELAALLGPEFRWEAAP